MPALPWFFILCILWEDLVFLQSLHPSISRRFQGFFSERFLIAGKPNGNSGYLMLTAQGFDLSARYVKLHFDWFAGCALLFWALCSGEDFLRYVSPKSGSQHQLSSTILP